MSLGEFCPWTFSIIFSLFIDRFRKIRSQNDHQNTQHILLYLELKIEILKSACMHTQYVQKLGEIGRACTQVNLGQITIMNQIYSEAHSHDYFEPSFAKIRSLFKKIQIKWQNVLLPIRKAPLCICNIKIHT